MRADTLRSRPTRGGTSTLERDVSTADHSSALARRLEQLAERLPEGTGEPRPVRSTG